MVRQDVLEEGDVGLEKRRGKMQKLVESHFTSHDIQSNYFHLFSAKSHQKLPQSVFTLQRKKQPGQLNKQGVTVTRTNFPVEREREKLSSITPRTAENLSSAFENC